MGNISKPELPFIMDFGINDPYEINVFESGNGYDSITPLVAFGIVDLVYEASHSANTKFTDVPLETGAVVSDGAVDSPIRITLKILVSDVDQTAFRNNRNGSEVISEMWVDYRQPNVELNASGWGIAKSNRARMSLDYLQNLRRNNSLLTIRTIFAEYDNMVIERIKTSETIKTGNGMLATITLKQLKFVSGTLVQKLSSNEFLYKMTPSEVDLLNSNIKKAMDKEEALSKLAEKKKQAEARRANPIEASSAIMMLY